MSFDPIKRKANLRKHHIDLADCYAAFDEPMLTREDGREDYGEQRWISLARLQVASSFWCGRIATTAPD